MKYQDSNLEYLKAKNRVEKLKRFYIHLGVYFVINSIITVIKVMYNMNKGLSFEDALFNFPALASWVIWGLVLAIHAFSVYGLPLILGYDWEERKIEQYMNEELNND
ncbi:2TM domain-containing protein [Winogradskyella endarachnes]|uniref:2TM domain-containing protein n=1 Tax=Winogradskyella endarachnes TaxID=2681965 RepID=A0A6L6UB96_9FLAO|nr:2TM domain-containing protein [Winogradskyella endarachnes]MUU78177.1 hypothetical protein [Winogradskyella endarachnes]